jgi:hypothetical protein
MENDDVVVMLHHAAELEHELCCQYLYAAWTLRRGGDPGVDASTAALTEQWEQQIVKIAAQEMYHLLLASNLLTALGVDPHLERPNFPQPASKFSEIGLPAELAPFSAATVGRFVCWEKPEAEGWWWQQCPPPAAAGGAEAPYRTIGQLYDEISQTLVAHPGWIDPDRADLQVTSAMVPFSPKVHAITKADDAADYIEIIKEQGEGASDWTTFCHFAYFEQIAQTLAAAGGDGSFGWPTVSNPSFGDAPPPGSSPIDDPVAGPIGVLFNDLYLIVLRTLSRLFIPDGESPAERQALANAALAIMPLALKPLGLALCRVPAGAAYPNLFAGPSFQLPNVIELPYGAHTEVIPDLAGDLLAVAQRARALAESLADAAESAAAALGLVAARLETLAPLYTPMGALA